MTDTAVVEGAGTSWFAGITPEAAGFSNADPNVAKAEFAGYMTNRGYDKKDAASAFADAMKAHREAEKHLGAPADQLLRMPKDANDAEGNARLAARLGVPADGKYDFANVKLAGDKPLPTSLTDALAPALASARVGKDAAPEVAKAVAKYLDSQEGAAAADKAAALAADREALKINWGSNVEANLLVAKGAATALGITPEQIAALEGVVGYGKVMEMFRNIGSKIGEDTFVKNAAPGGTGVMSGEQAEATLTEKLRDNDWATKLSAGDTTVQKEFNSLTTLVTAFRARR